MAEEYSDRVDLIFTPLYERVAATNLVLVKSDMHQMIGYFSGHITTADGERIDFDRLNGCAEEHNTLW